MGSHQKHASLAKPVWDDAILPTVNGLILAGGESQRMGRDKATLHYYGQNQLDYLASLMRPFVDEVFVSCHSLRSPDTDHKLIPDTFLDLGPYGGVLSAFRRNPNCAWLTVACDMPMVSGNTFAQLADSRNSLSVATCFNDPATNLPEPMLALWEPRAYPVLLEFLGKGYSCLRKVLIQANAHQLQPANPFELRNANTPDEAAELIRMIAKGSPLSPGKGTQ